MDEEELFYHNLPADSATGRITADTYDWMTRIDQKDQLQYQATASFILGQLSKWTPMFLMFLLPLQALLFKIFYPHRRYMEHFAHATHLSSFLLVLMAVPAGILLWDFNLGRDNNINIGCIQSAILFLSPLALLLYQLVSMRTVYHDGWGKTTVKCLLVFGIFNLLAFSLAAMLIIFLVFKATGKM